MVRFEYHNQNGEKINVIPRSCEKARAGFGLHKNVTRSGNVEGVTMRGSRNSVYFFWRKDRLNSYRMLCALEEKSIKYLYSEIFLSSNGSVNSLSIS